MTERGCVMTAYQARLVRQGVKTQVRYPIDEATEGTTVGTLAPSYVQLIRRGGGTRWHEFPLGSVGDRIYIREPWLIMELVDGLFLPSPRQHDRYLLSDEYVEYQAVNLNSQHKYNPSTWMPRRFSGLRAVITGVRVERVQDVTQEDVRREGFESLDDYIKEWNRVHARVRERGWGRHTSFPFSEEHVRSTTRRNHEPRINPFTIVYSFNVLDMDYIHNQIVDMI